MKFLILLFSFFFLSNWAYSQNEIYAYSWTDNSNGRACRIIKSCRIGLQSYYDSSQDIYSISSNINDIINRLNQMPEGHHVLQIWLPMPYINILINNVADRLHDSAYQRVCDKTLGCNIFWEQGAKEMQSMFSRFFQSLKLRGASVDYLMLDIEFKIDNWRVVGNVNKNIKDRNKIDFKIRKSTYLTKAFDTILMILRDRYGRLPGIIKNINTDKIGEGIYDSQQNYILFNSYFQSQFCRYLDKAFYIPAKKYFPHILCSNYNCFYQSLQYKIPDQYGHLNYLGGKGCIVGTDQAPSLYGYLSSSFLQFPPPGHLGLNFQTKVTPFDALLYDVNLLKSLIASSSIPVFPYFASKSFVENGYRLGNTDYYQENLFHGLLSGCKLIFLWNPTSTSSYHDDMLVTDCIQSVDSLLNFARFENRIPISYDSANKWSYNYVLSGIKTLKGCLWRFTPDWQLLGGLPLTDSVYKSRLRSITVNIAPLSFKIGSQRIIFPKGAKVIYPFHIMSYAGYWIQNVRN